MAILRSRFFGEVDVDHRGAYEKRYVILGGHPLERAIYVDDALVDQAKLDRAGALLDDLERLDIASRAAIAAELAHGTVVAEFVAFHLDELDAATLHNIFGGDVPSEPGPALAHLALVGAGLHPSKLDSFELVLDYSFGRAQSDQLLAIRFDDSGAVISLSHES
jgi:hypothetical protein